MAGLFQRLIARTAQRAVHDRRRAGRGAARATCSSPRAAASPRPPAVRVRRGHRAGFCLMAACQDCWVRLADGRRVRACSTVVEPGMAVMIEERPWLTRSSRSSVPGRLACARPRRLPAAAETDRVRRSRAAGRPDLSAAAAGRGRSAADCTGSRREGRRDPSRAADFATESITGRDARLERLRDRLDLLGPDGQANSASTG